MNCSKLAEYTKSQLKHLKKTITAKVFISSPSDWLLISPIYVKRWRSADSRITFSQEYLDIGGWTVTC